MDIKEAAINILNIGKNQNLDPIDWDVAKKQFLVSLQDCNDPDIMEAAVDTDVSYLLPVDLRISLYRKLLLFRRTPGLLREFAQYLDMHGPDWDDEVEELLKVADKLDSL